MKRDTQAFYDDLAPVYHLLFEDWDRSIARQSVILGPLVEAATGSRCPSVLDCACGIGTQSLGLAGRGHRVVGSDLSASAIGRARQEARQRSLSMEFHVADMRHLTDLPETGFDAVLAADNALPHLLLQEDLVAALTSMASKLRPSGVLLASIRDYDALIPTRPEMQGPTFYDGGSRIVHQVWQWDGDTYTVHLYITLSRSEGWTVHHFVSRYRALLRADLERALQASGFAEVRWLEPAVTSFYQPIVLARKKAQ